MVQYLDMKQFLQKTLIGVSIALLLIVVFWNNLTATAFWGMALYQTSGTTAVRTVPSAPLTLSPTDQIASSTTYSTLQIPHIFNNTEVLSETDTIIVFSDVNSSAYYLVSTMAAYREGFMAGQADVAAGEQSSVCLLLAETYSQNPCTSDRAFLDTIMQVSSDTAGIFSGAEQKSAAATFLLLKSTYLPAQTEGIVPFATDTLDGHLAIAPNQSVGYLFDQSEVGYEIAFINMNREQIEATLAGIAKSEILSP